MNQRELKSSIRKAVLAKFPGTTSIRVSTREVPRAAGEARKVSVDAHDWVPGADLFDNVPLSGVKVPYGAILDLWLYEGPELVRNATAVLSVRHVELVTAESYTAVLKSRVGPCLTS